MDLWLLLQPLINHRREVGNIIENINEIDRIYTNPDKSLQGDMEPLLDDAVQRSYFIGKLTTQFDAGWFVFALENGVLSFASIPPPQIIEGDDGNVSRGFKNWEGAFVIVEAAKSLQEFPQLIPLVVSLIDSYIELTLDKKNDSDRNFTVDYHICRCIFFLPVDKITPRHLAFVQEIGLARDRSLLSREMTTNFFYKVIEHDQTLIYRLLEIFFSPTAEQKRYRITGIIDDYALESFVQNSPKILFQQLGEDIVDWSVEKLQSLSRTQRLSFSKFELTSLEPDGQNHNENGFNFSLARFTLQLLMQLDEERLLIRVQHIIETKEPILRRIAYLIVDRNYVPYNALFWVQANPLNDTDAKLEIYRLINRNCEQFEKAQVEIIVFWIDQLKVTVLEEDTPERSKQRRAYNQLEWYVALEPIHFKYEELLIKPYNELQGITKGEHPAHPGYDTYFTIRPGGDYSQSNRILNRSVIDVLNIMANPARWEGYNVYGLQQDVRDYVIASYATVIENLQKFEAIPVTFLYNFMDAFRTLAEKGVSFGIERFLQFVALLIEQRNELWDTIENDQENATSIGMIAWTLNAIAQNNDYQLKLSDVRSAVHSLITMDNKYKGEFQWLNAEPVMDIINSTRGKIYDALFNYSIKEVRLQPNSPPFWDSEIRDHFTSKLISHSATTEFYWSMGFHIPQISYLDMLWIVEYLDILLDYHEDGHDCPVFEGYLLTSTQLYTNLFDVLYKTYLGQIGVLTDNSTTVRRFVEHIWIAFAIDLPGAEQLMAELLKVANANQFNFLIDRISHEDTNINTQRVKYIWSIIVAVAENTDDNLLKRKAFNTVHFADVIKKLDNQCVSLFMRALAFGGTNLNTYRLLRTVEAKISLGQFEIAGNLLKALLDQTSSYTYFDENQIIEIERSLYQHRFVEIADSIAIASVNRRYFSLVSIYNSYHDRTMN